MQWLLGKHLRINDNREVECPYVARGLWNNLHNPFRIAACGGTCTQGCPTNVEQPWAALLNAFSVRCANGWIEKGNEEDWTTNPLGTSHFAVCMTI